MKTLLTLAAATILATSTAVSADWDMPFFGDDSNSNFSMPFFGDDNNSNWNNANNWNNDHASKGAGDFDGDGEFAGSFSFSMKASGQGRGNGTGSSANDFSGHNFYNGAHGHHSGFAPQTAAAAAAPMTETKTEAQ